MTRKPAPSLFHGQERLHALDNMRTTLVVLVVMLHAACAYSILIPWWPNAKVRIGGSSTSS